MNVTDLAKEFKITLLELSNSGRKTLRIGNVIKYLDEVIADPNHLSISKDVSEDFRTAELNHESSLENFKAIISAGQNAIRTMVLINGAAAIAILAFIGNIGRDQKAQIAIMAPTLLPFAIGAFLGGVTSGATYLSQWLYSDEKTVRFGFAVNIFCITAGLLSYVAFFYVVLKVYAALTE